MRRVPGLRNASKLPPSACSRHPKVAPLSVTVARRRQWAGRRDDQSATRIGVSSARTFHVDDKGLRVETTVKNDGVDKAAELYETLPVFLREASLQSKATPTKIEFRFDGKWTPATAEFQEKVTAIKLTRFDGAVEIVFDRPQRVKPVPFKEASLSYTIGAIKN